MSRGLGDVYKRQDETLSGVVEDCVNAVGVDLNTASAPLLSYVAGLNNTTARNIVKYREENGAFTHPEGGAQGAQAGAQGL